MSRNREIVITKDEAENLYNALIHPVTENIEKRDAFLEGYTESRNENGEILIDMPDLDLLNKKDNYKIDDNYTFDYKVNFDSYSQWTSNLLEEVSNYEKMNTSLLLDTLENFFENTKDYFYRGQKKDEKFVEVRINKKLPFVA